MYEVAASKIPLPPILCSVQQAAAALGRGTTAIYMLIADKEIRAVKSNGRTLVDVRSLHAYADKLPDAEIKPRYRKPQRE